jgi:hypothetical protein
MPSRVTDRIGSELTWLIVAKVNSPPPAPIASTGMLSLWPATRVEADRSAPAVGTGVGADELVDVGVGDRSGGGAHGRKGELSEELAFATGEEHLGDPGGGRAVSNIDTQSISKTPWCSSSSSTGNQPLPLTPTLPLRTSSLSLRCFCGPPMGQPNSQGLRSRGPLHCSADAFTGVANHRSNPSHARGRAGCSRIQPTVSEFPEMAKCHTRRQPWLSESRTSAAARPGFVIVCTEDLLVVQIYCGGRGIRTPGGLHLAAFQEPCIRPLCHPSRRWPR